MKSKLALIAVLALGILVGGTGVALAANGSAGTAQYAPEEDDNEFCVEEGSGSGSGGNESGNGCEHPCVEQGSGSAGESGESPSGSNENCVYNPPPPQPPAPAQNLPYTGFSAIPMLLIGAGLLGGGLLIRRRSSRGHFPAA